MKQFWVFVHKEWLDILRDRKTLFILFGMPIEQILIFGFALSNEVKNSKIAIYDQSNDKTTEYLIERIEASHYFDITDFLNSDHELESVFKKGHINWWLCFLKILTSNCFNNMKAMFN